MAFKSESGQLAQQISIDAPDPPVILAQDVNDDGKLDLVVVNAFSTVAVLYGNGNGTFQNPQYFTLLRVKPRV